MLLADTAIDREHLDHAYALTVHRAQGSTYDRAHFLAAGGGRELTYAALSRARDRTTIHAGADDPQQAVDDLQADWDVAHHQRWISQTPASAGVHPEPRRRTDQPTAPAGTLEEARIRIAALIRDDQDLPTGIGRWQHTPQGQAATRLQRARSRLRAALQRSATPDLPRRARRAARKAVADLESTVTAADRDSRFIGAPVADELASVIAAERRQLAHGTGQVQYAGSPLRAIASDLSDYEHIVDSLLLVDTPRAGQDLGIGLSVLLDLCSRVVTNAVHGEAAGGRLTRGRDHISTVRDPAVGDTCALGARSGVRHLH